MPSRLFMGIDVGTGGARAIVVDEQGLTICEASRPFEVGVVSSSQTPGWHQQSPHAWWASVVQCIRQVVSSQNLIGGPESIYCVSVTSTSGTVIPLDDSHDPIYEAVMYNDNRAINQAATANSALHETCGKLAYSFDPSFGLPKMLWFMDQRRDIFDRTKLYAHAGDYIIGRLSGEFGITDYSNSLKSGFDLVEMRWPGEIGDKLGLPISKLPKVLPPGTIVGKVSSSCSRETGLAKGTKVALGMTDGCTSQIASGAASLGDWNTTIGTTLVIKGVTKELLLDPKGRIYSHRHPDGHWMPGGASNVGGDCVKNNFMENELEELNGAVNPERPTGIIVYPLEKKGERFPIRHASAEGFTVGKPASRIELYQAYLEGVAFVEKLSYGMLEGLGAVIGDTIYAAGGATRSKSWLKIRANVLDRAIAVPEVPAGHMGAAILAATQSHWGTLGVAAKKMVRIANTLMPDSKGVAAYKQKYGRFLEQMQARGYIREE